MYGKHPSIEVKPRSVSLYVVLAAASYAFDSGMKVHQTLVPAMTVFEGLDLREVPAGKYIFVGLPLRIKTGGAPARAILISL